MRNEKQEMIGVSSSSKSGIQSVVRLTSLIRVAILALSFVLFFPYHSFAQDNGSTIQVGIFQNYPIVFLDDSEVPRGLYVDLLREIANSEKWDIQFVPGTWFEGIERLRSAEIDLMTSIAYLDEREVYMDFSHENVLTMWGQVYVHRDSDIQNVLDLQGETIAILKGGINGINFMTIVSNFDIQCEFRVVDSYAEVAELVASGSVPAGVINNIHGYEQEEQYAIRRSPIVFSPFSLLLAVPEGKNHYLLETIDSYLAKWKSDPESPYYSITAKWFGQTRREVLPDWVFRALFFGGGLLLLVAAWVLILRHQVKVRTKDLTESRERSRRSEERFRIIMEQSPLGIQIMTTDGRIVQVNDAYEKLWGITLEDVREYNILQDEQAKSLGLMPYIERAFAGEALSLPPVEYDPRKTVKKGRRRWIQSHIYSIEDQSGEIRNVVMMHEDITDRVWAEQEKLASEAHLRQSQKLESIGTLASGVAHEVNNPLMGIINYAELLKDEPTDEQAVQYADGIIKEGNRVATIVQNLLSFARQDKETHSPANIKDIIDVSLSLVGATLRKDQIELELDVPDDLPKVKCRSQQIEQVVINLLTNARDALNLRYPGFDENKILSITVRPLEKDGAAWIRTTIEDHGAGIPEDSLERIFDPFFTTKPRDEGTGLGLSVSYGIMKEHHGELTVESKEGSYTRFHVDLLVDNDWTLRDQEERE